MRPKDPSTIQHLLRQIRGETLRYPIAGMIVPSLFLHLKRVHNANRLLITAEDNSCQIEFSCTDSFPKTTTTTVYAQQGLENKKKEAIIWNRRLPCLRNFSTSITLTFTTKTNVLSVKNYLTRFYLLYLYILYTLLELLQTYFRHFQLI